MGWETRERGGRYYYRKERDGSRVRSVYVGSGVLAQSAAMLAGMEHEEKDEERAAVRREIENQDSIDSRIDAVCELTEMLVTTALIASGHHQHKRQWRLKRHGKENR